MVSVSIRSSGTNVVIDDVITSEHVSVLKQRISVATGVPVDEQRLVFSGHVLQDDKTMDSYDIADGSSIHMIRKVATTTTTTTTSTNGTTTSTPTTPQPSYIPQQQPTSLFAPATTAPQAAPLNPAGANPNIEALMRNPQAQQMMRQMLADPRFLQHVMSSNPQLASNPEALAMLRNPEFLRMMSDPSMIRNALSAQTPRRIPKAIFDAGMAALNGGPIPETYPRVQFNTAPRIQHSQANPAPSSAHPQARAALERNPRVPVTSDLLSRALGAALNRAPQPTTTTATTTPATTAPATTTPAETATTAAAAPDTTTATTNNVPTTTTSVPAANPGDAVPPSAQQTTSGEQYVDQLAQLSAMGFTNRAQCIAALNAVNGDVNAALAFLFD